jgi:UDP-GlcNAc3NAcA epimerase
MILTDSGGVMKEAYFHQVPCLIMDTQIEWIESVNEGWSHIVGPNKNLILEKIRHFGGPSVFSHFLGDGTAAKQIVNHITTFLQ